MYNTHIMKRRKVQIGWVPKIVTLKKKNTIATKYRTTRRDFSYLAFYLLCSNATAVTGTISC